MSVDELMEDTVGNLKNFRAKFECELPNKDIHHFQGNITVTHRCGDGHIGMG